MCTLFTQCAAHKFLGFNSQSKAISPASAFPTGIQVMLEPSSVPAQESCCCNTGVTDLASWLLAHMEELLVASQRRQLLLTASCSGAVLRGCNGKISLRTKQRFTLYAYLYYNFSSHTYTRVHMCIYFQYLLSSLFSQT